MSESISCPGCWGYLSDDDLCGCDTDTGPLCDRCCRAEHQDPERVAL